MLYSVYLDFQIYLRTVRESMQNQAQNENHKETKSGNDLS